jgi:hypothetical protein
VSQRRLQAAAAAEPLEEGPAVRQAEARRPRRTRAQQQAQRDYMKRG